MITSVAQGVKNYRAELRAYARWVNKKKKEYGNENPLSGWGGSDWRRINGWNDELRAMEKVLGLTAQEAKSIEVECRVAQKKPKSSS